MLIVFYRTLVASIKAERTYVHLDLSACTMNGISFDPRGGNSVDALGDGREYILSLILPAAATNIVAGNSSSDAASDAAFYGFNNLQSISGANITEIGDYAFSGLYTSLYNPSGGLQEVDFPKATTIGNRAFERCLSLKSVSFPQVTTIGNYAFINCTSLQSADFSQVSSIGDSAFSGTGTTALVITMGSTAPTLDYRIFSGVAKTVTVKIPSSATGYSPSLYNGEKNVTVSGTNTDANWANGFRGGGWTGSGWPQFLGGTSYIDKDITLIIERK